MPRKQWLVLAVLIFVCALVVWHRKHVFMNAGLVTPPDVPERRVSIVFDGTLADLAKELERQTGLRYEVVSELQAKPVKFECRDAPIFRAHMLLSKEAGVELVRDENHRIVKIVGKKQK